MKEPSVAVLKKYLDAFDKLKAKYVTSERLSKVVGVYPEVINEVLSYFDPMVMMDYEYDLLELVPSIKEYIDNKEKGRISKLKETYTDPVSKKEVEKYANVNDFIYEKMSFGGLINKDAYFSDHELRQLKKIIDAELSKRRKK